MVQQRQRPLFDGLTFAVVASTDNRLCHAQRRQDLRRKITSNGGRISYVVTRQCDYALVVDDDAGECFQWRTAERYQVPVVRVAFVDDCISHDKLLDHDTYAVSDAVKDDDDNRNFRKGVIVLDDDSSVVPSSLACPRPPKVWHFRDPLGPRFHFEPYQVVKFTVLMGGCPDKRQRINTVVLEIHASVEGRNGGFCIYAETVSGSKSSRTCQYCDEADVALDNYEKLFRRYTNPPQSMTPWSGDADISEDIGSPQLQKDFRKWLSFKKPVDNNVADLVDNIWNEAVGRLDDVLSVNVYSISMDNVEKAAGLLHRMASPRDIEEEKDIDDQEDLETQFYELVPQHVKNYLTSASARAKQHDLLQLVRDMLMTKEAIDAAVVARCHALDCYIKRLDNESDELSLVRNMLLSTREDVDLVIENVFEVRRSTEDIVFRQNLGNRKLLFHATDVSNIVGILSRGLLLPKIVDNHSLGSGIYFADKSSTSVTYSGVGPKSKRRMLLVVEVALGNSYDTERQLPDIVQAPDGYDSVHGLKSTPESCTHFVDDEYAIYCVNQQRLRYLVEFSVTGDDTTPCELTALQQRSTSNGEVLTKASNVRDKSAEELLSEHVHDSPKSEIRRGLLTRDNLPVILREVHVRAQLVDLAAKVVLMQSYVNPNDVNVEARYVFPLDDLGAVCGFEAFINDKHVVGVVKEKLKAHRDYRKAVHEGHGAYLMDQEMPDVFVLSLGNIPPAAIVVIKISYVTELTTDGELINFVLDQTLPSWHKNLAPLEPVLEDSVDVIERTLQHTSLEISVEMPFEVVSIVSPTHHIRTKRTDTMATVKMAADDILDRKFQLLIGLAEIHVPRMWVERHPEDGTEACMLTFYPTFEHRIPDSGTVILALDASNSMKCDEAFRLAQAVCLLCLRRLDANWHFNVVVFGTTYRELFAVPQRKSPDNHDTAKDFILRASADMGSTVLHPVLQQFFLLPPPRTTTDRQYQSVFLISDGHLSGNSAVLLDQVSKYHNVCRTFTFGIDTKSVPCNRHLMRCLANRGAGFFEVFDRDTISKWEDKVTSQLDKAAQPVLTDIDVEWQCFENDGGSGRRPTQAPCHLTTLFHGSRQVIYGFVANCTVATLHARVEGREMSTVVSTSELRKTEGKLLHTLASRAIIRDWEDGLLSEDRVYHEAMKYSMKSSAIRLSKTFGILTSVTSFIAIEQRKEGEEVSGKNVSILELLTTEAVDKLPYIEYEQKNGDVTARHMTVKATRHHVLRSMMSVGASAVEERGEPFEMKTKKRRKKTTEAFEPVPVQPMRRHRKVILEPESSQDDEDMGMGLFDSDSSDSIPVPSILFGGGFVPCSAPVPPPSEQSAPEPPVPTTQKSLDFRFSNLDSCFSQLPPIPMFQCATSSNSNSFKFGAAAAPTFAFDKSKSPKSFELPSSFGSRSSDQLTSAFGQPYSSSGIMFGSPRHQHAFGNISLQSTDVSKRLTSGIIPETIQTCSSLRQIPVDSPVTFEAVTNMQEVEYDEQVYELEMSKTHESDSSEETESVEEQSADTPYIDDHNDRILAPTDVYKKHAERSKFRRFGGGIPMCSEILDIFEKDLKTLLPENVPKYLTMGKHVSEANLRLMQEKIADEFDEAEDDDEEENSVLDDILAVQETTGYFTLNWVRCWIDTDKLERVLVEAGIATLGDVQFTIFNLCATIAAIQRLISHFDDGLFIGAVEADDQHLKVVVRLIVNSVSRRQLARILLALLYVAWAERRHPLVYYTLRIADNWEDFVSNFVI